MDSLNHQLHQPTEFILTSGGDERIVINFSLERKENKYLSSTVPNNRLIRRGSCTCSTTTEEDYDLVTSLQKELINQFTKISEASDRSSFLNSEYNSLTIRLQTVLNSTTSGVVLFPSGSDAEYLPLSVGLIRSYNLSNGNKNKMKVYNIVVAAGEVGSGTANAANGQHFSNLAPAGKQQQVGQYLNGINEHWVEVIQRKPRNITCKVDFNEEEIIQCVQNHLKHHETSVAILHVVCGTKTGLIYPSKKTIELLQNEFNNRLLVVIDACQLRCKMNNIQNYCINNYISLITSSKFYTAPPFAGAVVIPSTIVQEIEDHLLQHPEDVVIPIGIVDYLTPFDVSPGMNQFRKYIERCSKGEAAWMNIGSYLRWQCGIRSMERYHTLPQPLVDSFTQYWVQFVQDLIQPHSPFLQLLVEDTNDEALSFEEMPGAINSIVSFTVFVPIEVSGTGPSNGLQVRRLNFDECKKFHSLMTKPFDLSYLDILHSEVMLGQPVKLSDNGSTILRIALGADMVIDAVESYLQLIPSDAVDPDSVNVFHALHQMLQLTHSKHNEATLFSKILFQDKAVIDKMSYLAKHWTVLQQSDTLCQPSTHPSPELKKKFDVIDHSLMWSTIAKRTAPTPFNQSLVARVLRTMYPTRPLTPHHSRTMPDTIILYDLDLVHASFSSLIDAFHQVATSSTPYIIPQTATTFLHCFAIKSCPISYILHRAVQSNLGLEAASIGEVQQALRVGCKPDHLIFDSPCKSTPEIEFTLRKGVQLNANSYQELDKIDLCLKKLERQGVVTSSVIGLRVNPMVGVGSISALSTATVTSKFGVPLYSAECSNKTCQELISSGLVVNYTDEIVEVYRKYKFLSGIMCHVGSQGMSVDAMVEGSHRIWQLANKIDAVCMDGEGGQGVRRIKSVDIGGGLSVNYQSDETVPTFQHYADALYQVCPEIFSNQFRRIVTEFGKSLIAKNAVIVTRVEDTLDHPSSEKDSVMKTTGICHAGADLLLRTAYCPDMFNHRLSLLNKEFQLVSSFDSKSSSSDSMVCYRDSRHVTLAGPLCFSGDNLGLDLLCQSVQPNDYCIIHDAGANTLSLYSRHCSRLSPNVYGFRRLLNCNQPEGDYFLINCIREGETNEDVNEFWD